MDRKLKIPQVALLLRLRQSKEQSSYIGPKSSQHKPALALVALGLAVEVAGNHLSADGGCHRAAS